MAKASIESPTMDYVSHRGPYRVARGELALAGLPALIYAPVSGQDLPAVAFAHHWIQPVSRYTDTLRYLASWGIVAVAPRTERGPFGSPGGLGQDLLAALQLLSHVRLAELAVSVDPAKWGLAGHGTGGGAAVLAASSDATVKAVVTVSAANVLPSAESAAGLCLMPALHLAGGRDALTPAVANAEIIARAWAGPVQYRLLSKSAHLGFAEGKHWTGSLLGTEPEKSTQQVARALMTAFFLQHLNGQSQLGEDLAKKFDGTKPAAFSTL